MLVCDFCSQPPVMWRYPARGFSRAYKTLAARVVTNSHGDWAACEGCHAIIQRGDRDELTRHSAATMPGFSELPKDYQRITLRELRRIHDDFWAMREGAPEPVPVEAA